MVRTRIATTAGIFFVLFVIALCRAVQLCVFDGASFKQLATRQHQQRVELPSERGPIVDRHGDPLALTIDAAAVYVRPAKLDRSRHSITLLAHTLDLPQEVVTRKVEEQEPFVWLSRDATPEQADALAALALPGVGSDPALRRFYPRGPLAGQVIGFAGIDSQGLEGIELEYDDVLRGTGESLEVERDARGRRMLTDGTWRPLPRRGARVELTIDAGMQQAAEQYLSAAVTNSRAAAGTAVVMDPLTGEILALANVPRFDPNDIATSSPDRWRDRVIADTYEPGSTFKAILASAAIDAGVVRPNDRIFCEDGHYRIGRRTIHDHEPYGWLTFADVIKNSSNIGAAKVGARLGAKRFAAAIKAFGFGQLTGVDLPGEVQGLVWPYTQWAPINLATVSFGQGISVTPLQLVRAYAAIANGGKLMRPYIVRRVVAADGTILREKRPHVVGHPLSAKTAHIVTALLERVVESGTGTKARIDGMAIAGKTGTAQKVDPKTHRYSARNRMASFVGFFPADAPRLVILIVIDSPRTSTYGGIVAAPVFREIAEYGIDRLGLRTVTTPVPAPQPAGAQTQLVDWAVPSTDRGMPSFMGMSMREALVQAARAGWDVETRGSGFVIAQDPPPGAQTAKGRLLRLQFGSAAG